MAYEAGVSHHLHKFARGVDEDKGMTVDSSVTGEQTCLH